MAPKYKRALKRLAAGIVLTFWGGVIVFALVPAGYAFIQLEYPTEGIYKLGRVLSVTVLIAGLAGTIAYALTEVDKD